jgi:AcrR family transcriptional regulator
MTRNAGIPTQNQAASPAKGPAAAEPPGTPPAPRERLLDAAEALVARFGFDAPSVREITAAARVRLAAISEIFGGLERLTSAVVERRSRILAEERLSLLAKTKEKGPASLEAVVAAFIEPLFAHMETSQGWRHFAQVSAQLVSSTRWDKRLGHFLELEAPPFLDAIREAEPRLSALQATWCYTFLMGAVATSTSGTGWVPQLSEGVVTESDLGTLRAELLVYVPAAIRSVADAQDPVRANDAPIAKTRSAKTRDRILDVAERLFAAHGFYGVSMRSLASAAGISVGLCHYYFKSKESVFLAMCLRRHPELNEQRWQVLEEARAMPPGRDRLATVVDAHLGTLARRLERGGRGWSNHLRAMATAITSHGDYWLETLRVVSDDIIHAVVEESAKSIPGLSLRRAYIAHLFGNGLIAVGYSGSRRVERLSQGAAKGGDYRSMYAQLLPFHVGGVLGMAEHPDPIS